MSLRFERYIYPRMLRSKSISSEIQNSRLITNHNLTQETINPSFLSIHTFPQCLTFCTRSRTLSLVTSTPTALPQPTPALTALTPPTRLTLALIVTVVSYDNVQMIWIQSQSANRASQATVLLAPMDLPTPTEAALQTLMALTPMEADLPTMVLTTPTLRTSSTLA